MGSVLYSLDLIGVAVFAASGALVASRKEMDLIGFALMASLTGIGGGTVRDILLNRPVFWIETPLYVGVCLAIAVAIFFTAHIVNKRYVVLLWADAIGISAYSVMGAEVALRTGAGALVAVVMGVMTATFGGLARDVVANETPLILRKEVYATCTLAAAAVYVGLRALDVPLLGCMVVGFMVGFGLRGAGIALGLVLPTYKAQPGKDYD